MTEDVTIISLGHLGDGVAAGPHGEIFVPFVLPGEEVRIGDINAGHAELLKVLAPSPHRIAPACKHFGICGGCALQHVDALAYAEWKQAQVVATLRSRGIDEETARQLLISAFLDAAFEAVAHEEAREALRGLAANWFRLGGGAA
nr:hypothetical protein DBT45_10105 [Aerococcus tenax]